MPRRRRPPRPGALADLRPLNILSQMFLLQAFYWGIALVLIVFTTFVAGKHPEPGMIFDWRNVRGDVTTGWTLGLCWMLDALVTVIPLLLLIARSKLVPDFALTIHFINLVVTSLYTRHIPNTVAWWVLQICSVGLMCGLGIWACQWRELRPMVFGGNSSGSGTKQSQQQQGSSQGEGDVEAGYEMGSGRGGGRDGAGSYEMVGIGSSGREPS